MPQPEARQILDARLASGEISEEEYDRIRTRLDESGTADNIVTPSTLVSEATPSTLAKQNTRAFKKRFYLLRLWRGELSLPTTYWLWGAVGGVVVGLIAAAFMSTATTMSQATIPAVLVLVWATFIAVAIFRSGAAYQRLHPKKGWGRIAQVMACLGLLANLGNISKSLPGNEPESDLDRAVTEANRSSSQVVADNIRFDRLTRQGRTFIYAFTITGPTHIPPPDDVAKARKATIDTVCKGTDTHRLLLSVDKAVYRYVNEAGQELMTYNVQRSDCLN